RRATHVRRRGRSGVAGTRSASGRCRSRTTSGSGATSSCPAPSATAAARNAEHGGDERPLNTMDASGGLHRVFAQRTAIQIGDRDFGVTGHAAFDVELDRGAALGILALEL